jgi:hypothetical protein
MTEHEMRCMQRAEELASEINGDFFYVPDEDIEKCLSRLTRYNMEEIASELAELAYWFN